MRLKMDITVVLMALLMHSMASPANAMQKQLTLDEMVQEADGICVATVVQMGSRPSARGKIIVTDVEVIITEWVGGRTKQPEDNKLTFTLAGGTTKEKSLQVTDVPKLQLGQQYIFMLKLDGKPYLSPIVGAYQGLFKVIADESGGRTYPLTVSDNYVAGVKEDKLQLGPSVTGISGGIPKEKPSDPRLRPTVPPPQTVEGGTEARAQASVSTSMRAVPEPLTTEQFVGVIKEKLAAVNR